MEFMSKYLDLISSVMDDLTKKDFKAKSEFWSIKRMLVEITQQVNLDEKTLKDIRTKYLNNRKELMTLLKINRNDNKKYDIKKFLPDDIAELKDVKTGKFSQSLYNYAKKRMEQNNASDNLKNLVTNCINNLCADITNYLSTNEQLFKNKQNLKFIKTKYNQALNANYNYVNTDKIKDKAESKFYPISDSNNFTEECFDVLWRSLSKLYKKITELHSVAKNNKFVSKQTSATKQMNNENSNIEDKLFAEISELQKKLYDITDFEIDEINTQVLKKSELNQ